jgi:hypothetical protein
LQDLETPAPLGTMVGFQTRGSRHARWIVQRAVWIRGRLFSTPSLCLADPPSLASQIGARET